MKLVAFPKLLIPQIEMGKDWYEVATEFGRIMVLVRFAASLEKGKH